MELKATVWSVRGRTGIIELNRPHRANAWTGRMDTEYKWLLAQADADPAIRAIVITGSGERFCVGGDSQALESHAQSGSYDRGLTEEQAQPGYGVETVFDQPFASHFGLTKPIIAAINGAAAGVGLALAAFCDLRFASPGAKLTTAHGKLGLPAEYGLSWILPRIVGLGRALDLLMTSRVVLAEEAQAMGFINAIHPADTLLDATVEYAETLSGSVAAQSLRATRWQVYRDLHRDVATSMAESIDLIDDMTRTDEYREGIAAFVERRPPSF